MGLRQFCMFMIGFSISSIFFIVLPMIRKRKRKEQIGKKRRRTWGGVMKYPKDMDTAMIPLCDALNAIDGIETRFCCEGHGRDEFYIAAVIHKGNSFFDALDAYRAIFLMLPSNDFPFRFDMELTYAFPPRSQLELMFVVRCRELGHQLDENIRYAAIRTITDRALAFGKKEVRT